MKDLSFARFEGPDASSFLQTQLSADIAALEPGDATYACYCSPRGQVFGLLLVCREEACFNVVAASHLLPGILKRLKMYVMRAKVEISEPPAMQVCGVTGSDIDAVPGIYQPAGSPLRYRFSEQADTDETAALRFKAEEIRNHTVWLSAETTEKFIPQMLGFDQLGAVSFSKGCYPGQEIVARARYLGKVKRDPLVVKLESNLLINASQQVELRRGEDWLKGTVIDSVSSDDDTTLVFIIAPSEPSLETSELRVQEQTYRCATM